MLEPVAVGEGRRGKGDPLTVHLSGRGVHPEAGDERTAEKLSP